MVAVIILAAGQSKRMQSAMPKILHPLGGKPVLEHVLDTVQSLTPDQILIVTSPTLKDHLLFQDITVVVQKLAIIIKRALLWAIIVVFKLKVLFLKILLPHIQQQIASIDYYLPVLVGLRNQKGGGLLMLTAKGLVDFQGITPGQVLGLV